MHHIIIVLVIIISPSYCYHQMGNWGVLPPVGVGGVGVWVERRKGGEVRPLRFVNIVGNSPYGHEHNIFCCFGPMYCIAEYISQLMQWFSKKLLMHFVLFFPHVGLQSSSLSETLSTDCTAVAEPLNVSFYMPPQMEPGKYWILKGLQKFEIFKITSVCQFYHNGCKPKVHPLFAR